MNVYCIQFKHILFADDEKEQTKTIKEAIESLFKVSKIFTSSGNADEQAKMSELQMGFGILLQSCGLMEMTKDAVEGKIMDMKHKLDESQEVSHSLPLAHPCLKSCHPLPVNSGAY